VARVSGARTAGTHPLRLFGRLNRPVIIWSNGAFCYWLCPGISRFRSWRFAFAINRGLHRQIYRLRLEPTAVWSCPDGSPVPPANEPSWWDGPRISLGGGHPLIVSASCCRRRTNTVCPGSALGQLYKDDSVAPGPPNTAGAFLFAPLRLSRFMPIRAT
jgi:hypothetical protein